MNEDNILIKKYLDGDHDSLKIIIDKYTPSVYNFVYRFVGSSFSDDIVQDVFIKVWKNLNKFNLEKSQFKTWLFTIARNTVTDYLRKKKNISFSDLKLDNEEKIEDIFVDGELLPDEVLQKIQDKEYLNKLLDQMPINYKEILVLYYQGDMTFSEIGNILGKPLNTVKSGHRRAIEKLKKIIS